MNRTVGVLVGALVLLTATGLQAQSPAPGAAVSPQTALTPAGSVGLFVYPQKKQGPNQQASDEKACYASAKQQSGVDPTAPPPPPQDPGKVGTGSTVKGAAGGAAGGAAVGAIAGDAGQGAAIGATVGAVAGHRRKKKAQKAANQQAVTTAQQQQAARTDSFKRAMSACLDARGYSVK